MKRAKILLASIFAVLLILGSSQQTSAKILPAPDLVIDPHGVDVAVSSTFSINIWIKNIPQDQPEDWGMAAFEFKVTWDPAMMELAGDFPQMTSHAGWSGGMPTVDEVHGIYRANDEKSAQTPPWTEDAVWLTLNFHCLAEGSTKIFASDLASGTVWLEEIGGTMTSTGPFDGDEITVNQHAPISNPPAYVGGELFTANKVAVLAPYLVGILSIVAVAAVVVKRRRV